MMITALLGALTPVISDALKLIPNPAERERVKAEMTAKILEQEATILSSMKDVMVADASSDNKLTSAARPLVVYWAMGFITFLTLLGSLGMADGAIAALEKVPAEFWQLLTVGIGAFSLTRGLEKSVTAWKK